MWSHHSLLVVAALLAALSGRCSAGCREEALSLHNQLRAKHAAPTVVWDDSLAERAQKWVKQLAAEGCTLKHSQEASNLYVLQGAASSAGVCTAAARHWYSEVENYQFTAQPWTDNEQNWGKIAHVTNMLWQSSERVGCAQASSPAGCTIVGCMYDPSVVADNTMFFSNMSPAAVVTAGGSGSMLSAGTTLPRVPAREPSITWSAAAAL